MKVRNLHLKSFRQHRDAYFTFVDGVTGIVGPNGAGKSTIVEAIAFSLYGTKALRGKIDDVASRGIASNATDDDAFETTLIFEHDEIVYRITRSRSDASLLVGGEPQPVCVGQREVTARVTTVLGMTYEEFVATYYTEQKGLEFLSGKKGITERERFVVRMMGYDRLEKLQELLRDDRRDKRNEVQGFEASVGERADFEQRIAREQQTLIGLRTKLEESERALKNSEREYERARADVTRWEGAEREFARRKEIFRDRQFRHDEKVKRYKDLERDLAELPQNEQVPTESRQSVQASLRTAEENLRTVDERYRAAELSWQEAKSKASSTCQFLTQQLKDAQAKEKNILKLKSKGKCPTCEQSLGDSFESVQNHFVEDRKKIEVALQQATNEQATTQTVPPSISVIREELQQARDVVTRLRAALQRSEILFEQAIRRAGLLKEQDALTKALQLSEEELRLARTDLDNQKFSEDEYRREKGRADAAQRLLEVARLQRVKLEGETATAEALLARSKNDLAAYDEKIIALQQAKAHLELYEQGDQLITEFRKYLNSGIRPRLAELASEFMTELTDGRYTTVEVSEDFTPTVLDQGEVRTVLSGGEEDILNLSLRLALSHMIAERSGQSCALLILDEVFGSLDEQRRGNVLGLLERLATRFEQILIITHLEDVKDSVQHLVAVSLEEAEEESSLDVVRAVNL